MYMIVIKYLNQLTALTNTSLQKCFMFDTGNTLLSVSFSLHRWWELFSCGI